MDQDAFRKLLTTSGPSQKFQSGFTLPPKKSKSQNSTSLPSFQPRRLDKNQQRSTHKGIGADRQTRPGVGDHDPTDTLLEDITKDAISKDGHSQEGEGNGEEDHPVLVKGLDFALLEKTKSQLNTQTEDDALEATFQESQTKSDVLAANKRTREDLIRALKEKRTGPPDTPESSASAFEKAKQRGKFKPIGAQDTSTKKVKLKRKAGDVEVKPRKKKALEKSEEKAGIPTQLQDGRNASEGKPVSRTFSPPVEEVDIFADVGEYKGLELDEEEEEEENKDATDNQQDVNTIGQTQKNDWFKDDDISTGEEAGLSRSPGPTHLSVQPPFPSPPSEQNPQPSTVAPARLEPLASSSIPSIRDFLQVAETHEKRQARKKKKDNKERGNEDKINRDYQNSSFGSAGIVFVIAAGTASSTDSDMLVLPGWIQTVASVGMAVGPPLVYADQTYSIVKKRDSTGFSHDVCGILLIANVTRCFYWLGSRFELALLVQSILMILAQLFLLYICLRYRPSVSPENLALSSRPFSFWQWPLYWNYIEFLLALVLCHTISYLIFGRSEIYTSALGFLALGIESLLPVPQFISNFKRRSLWGFRLSTLLGWLAGDAYKTVYFFIQHSPLPFKVGAIFQLSVDFAILIQKLIYGSPPPAVVLEVEDLEQELVLDEDIQGT